MAGGSLTVDMGDDDLLPAFRTVIEVASAGIGGKLTLVGGLMVAVHARRAGERGSMNVELVRRALD